MSFSGPTVGSLIADLIGPRDLRDIGYNSEKYLLWAPEMVREIRHGTVKLGPGTVKLGPGTVKQPRNRETTPAPSLAQE